MYNVYHTIHPDNTSKGGNGVIIKESILYHQEMGFQNGRNTHHICKS